ncbi:hypothetical protein [Allomuricauda sp. M10]|uniref:hypothetical protein n=1 Tax=Allomuricauda sp. M10 TaxID=2683292 RepID=UPI001D19375B|nr:hypothetical protein [Muricauda sp. M10]
MSEHNQQIANNPKFLKRQAQEALKAAKMLERQHMANGAVWVTGPNRSRVLSKQ